MSTLLCTESWASALKEHHRRKSLTNSPPKTKRKDSRRISWATYFKQVNNTRTSLSESMAKVKPA